jgi:hypothetical protein
LMMSSTRAWKVSRSPQYRARYLAIANNTYPGIVNSRGSTRTEEKPQSRFICDSIAGVQFAIGADLRR